MKELIQGAYDLHVHSAPDVLPRKLDDLEMGRRIAAAGMGGYCIKSHYFCTGERAELLRAVQPDCDFLGSLVLNSTVGGLNPAAVELAARSGAKLIWMPTCDSAYEREHIFGDSRPEKLPFWANIILELEQNQIQNPTIRLLEEGALRQEVLEILDELDGRITLHDFRMVRGRERGRCWSWRSSSTKTAPAWSWISLMNCTIPSPARRL